MLLLAAFHVYTRTVMYIHVHTRTYIHMDTRAYTAVLEPSAWRAASHMASHIKGVLLGMLSLPKDQDHCRKILRSN